MFYNIHIYFVDAKDFCKRRDLIFTVFYINGRFGNLDFILGENASLIYKDILGRWCKGLKSRLLL